MFGEETVLGSHDTDVQASQQGRDPLVPKGINLWRGPAGFTCVGGFSIPYAPLIIVPSCLRPLPLVLGQLL